MSGAVLHPIVFGFTPAEISSIPNLRVVREHASEAGFLWRQRHRAIGAPHYKLKHLQMLDERVSAHLAGLCLAGDTGWQFALEALANDDPGAVFSATYLAFDSGVGSRIDHVLALALAEPAYADAFLHAMAWLPAEKVESTLALLAGSTLAQHRLLSCTAVVLRRDQDWADIPRFIEDEDPAVRTRALYAVGVLKRGDLRSFLADALHGQDKQCRLWAAWSSALFGDPQSAPTLFEIGLSCPDTARFSTEAAMRCAEHDWARQTISTLAAEPQMRRLAFIATGAFGDPTTVPWLIKHSGDERFGALAGEAISTITGADLKYLDLNKERPDNDDFGADTQDEEKEDNDLPWPDPERLQAWWTTQSHRYVEGQRYLCGEVVSESESRRILRDGYQRQRAAAAFELARLNPQAALFPTHARADRQTGRLSA